MLVGDYKFSWPGALSAAGLDTSHLAGVCAGMAGVDRQVDADAVKEALHSWLQNDEARSKLCKTASTSWHMLKATKCCVLQSCMINL